MATPRRAALVVVFASAVLGCSSVLGIGDLNIEIDAGAADATLDAASAPDVNAADGTASRDDSAAETPLGSGQDGALDVTTLGLIVNSYVPVTSALTPGSTAIPITNLGIFRAGDVVLVLQSAGMKTPPSSGSQSALDFSNSAETVGNWELATVASIGTSLALVKPLTKSYGGATQVVRVPQYTTVTIHGGASVAAGAWDGRAGGIVAFLANGTVTNDGAIRVDAVGFRGGATVLATNMGCSGDDGVPANGFAQKGEGIGVLSAVGGRGNQSNGAGGGDCHNAGGGGGGHGGRGGQGGFACSCDGARDVGGLGGASLSYSVAARVFFGGGGGAGDANDGTGSNGGRGGGVVFVRAQRIAGGGEVTARGGAGQTTNTDGGGGGGAGGALNIEAKASIACAGASVSGGRGGDSMTGGGAIDGPGGGGAGGHAHVAAPSTTCPIAIQAGLSGMANGSATGATPTVASDPNSQGVVE